MLRVPSVDGVELAVHDLGGEGPPLLLAHATGFHGLVWAPVAEHLRRGFRCYAFDERGHGDSTPPANDDWRWERFGLDALAVVSALGIERPFAVGHSCGGALLLLAEEHQPGTFAALYCYEPIVIPVDPPPGPNRDNPVYQSALRRRDAFGSRREAYDNYASKPPLSALDPAALSAYVDHGFADQPDGSVRLKCRSEDEAKVYLGGGAHFAYRHLGEVACPVVLACGDGETPIGPDVIAEQAARLPRARTEVFAGLGHFGPLEDPVAVAAAVRRALTE